MTNAELLTSANRLVQLGMMVEAAAKAAKAADTRLREIMAEKEELENVVRDELYAKEKSGVGVGCYVIGGQVFVLTKELFNAKPKMFYAPLKELTP